MRAIICIGGEIASGKTALARALAAKLDNSVVRSFGDVVRRRARRDGKPLDRSTLQSVGSSLVAAGWPSFVDALINDLPPAVEILVVEGIRHAEAIEEIAHRNLSDQLLTVYLQVDEQVQLNRLRDRGEFVNGRTHNIESSLPHVRARADLIIDGNLSLEENVSAVIRSLGLPLSDRL